MINETSIAFNTEIYLGCQVCYKKIKQTSIMKTFNELLKNRESFHIKRIVLQKISKPLEKFEDRPWNDN